MTISDKNRPGWRLIGNHYSRLRFLFQRAVIIEGFYHLPPTWMRIRYLTNMPIICHCMFGQRIRALGGIVSTLIFIAICTIIVVVVWHLLNHCAKCGSLLTFNWFDTTSDTSDGTERVYSNNNQYCFRCAEWTATDHIGKTGGDPGNHRSRPPRKACSKVLVERNQHRSKRATTRWL